MKACAVCGYPLEEAVERGQSLGYLHARKEHREDHIAVPVDPSEIRVNQRCDFCDGEPVTMLVLCASFRLPLPGPKSTSVGNWAACTACAHLISRRRWSALVTRVRRLAPATRGVPRSDIEAVYRAVEAHMIGIISVREWCDRRKPREG